MGSRWIVQSCLLGTASCLIGSYTEAQTPTQAPPQTPNAAAATSDARSPAGHAEPGGIQDILVTARRTEERLQTTPVAVTALNQEAVRNAQVTDVMALQRTTPSLSIATGSPGTTGVVYIAIRGATQIQGGIANDPAVATYIDGVYLPRASQGQVDLNDIKRVEVLRGPQGTLFGRNTPGGALNIVTNDPTDKFEGSIKLQTGNYGYVDGGGVLNVPLSDSLSARVVGDFYQHGSYAENVTLDRGVGRRRSSFVRGKLKFAPKDSDWSLVLSGDYNKITDNGQMVALRGFNAATYNGSVVNGFNTDLTPYLHSKSDWYKQYGSPFLDDPNGLVNPFDYIKAYGASATVNGGIGDVNVKSIFAYRYSKSAGLNELDATPLQILSTETTYRSAQYSWENQLSGDIGSRLNWITGTYFSTETGNDMSYAQTLGFRRPPGTTDGAFSLNNDDGKNRSIGVFAQANYKITDRLRATGGLRWTWDRREVTLHNLSVVYPATCSPTSVAPDGSCALHRKVDFNYPAWTAGFDYKATDGVFIYIKTSGAAKSGGWNVRNGAVPAFSPEKTHDVEAGLKLDALRHRLRFDVAGFYSWQNGVQRNISAFLPSGQTTQYLLNAGNAHVYGGEFELTALPWQGMTLSANLSLLHGGYEKGTFIEQQTVPNASPGVVRPGCVLTAAGSTTSICPTDRSGEALPELPKAQYNISATQKVPTGLGEVSIYVAWSHISSQTFGPFTANQFLPQATKDVYATASRLNRISGYGLLTGRIALQLENPNLELSVFGKNVLNKKYVTRAFSDLYTGIGTATEYYGNPRTWGVAALYRF